MGLKALKEEYINLIYQEKAFLIKKDYFQLHHGGESHLYLNHSQFLSQFKNLNLLVNNYLSLLPKALKNFKLGAVDSVMSPVICGLMAGKIKKDVVITKEKKLEHGLENKVYGLIKGEVILVDDVSSTGTTLINAAKVLRKEGVKVGYALVSACRDLTAVINLNKAKIKTFYIATYEEIIKVLWPKLKNWEKKAVLEEVKEKKYNWRLK